MKYRFENFELDTEKQELRTDDAQIPLEPQVFGLLELLITHSERVVAKDEINERVWGGRVVSDAAVNSRIRTLRKALNDNGKDQRVIKTIRDRGFRFAMTPQIAGGPMASVYTPPASRPALPPLSKLETNSNITQQLKPSIAVLPLKLLSLDTRYEPLADAIAHEVIADLSRHRWLHVISRASTFKMRSSDVTLTDTADTLGVDYVLSGTLALFGESATITVELYHTAQDGLVWAESIECDLSELIEVRLRIAKSLTNAIEQRIQNHEAQANEHITTEDLNAWMAYFRGLRHAYRFNKHDNDIATHLFEHAIKLDSQFALAHAGLSFTHFQNAFVGYAPDIEQAQQHALRSAERAFELDQLDPVTNLMVGRAKFLIGEWQQAGPWFERCITLSPNSALAYYHQALNHVIEGDVTEVDNLSTQALSLSPIDPLQYAFLTTKALANLTTGDSEEAAYWGEMAANAPRAHHLIDVVAAITHQCNGNTSQAEFRRSRALSRAPDFHADQFFRSIPLADDSVRERVIKSLEELDLS